MRNVAGTQTLHFIDEDGQPASREQTRTISILMACAPIYDDVPAPRDLERGRRVKALIGPCTPGVTCDNWWDFFNPGEWIEDAGESILDRIATGIGEFAQQLLTGVWWAIGEATTPDVNADFLDSGSRGRSRSPCRSWSDS